MVVEAPKASGNIDDTVKAIEAFSANEVSEINASNEGSYVADYDTDIESAYGNVYDETQF